MAVAVNPGCRGASESRSITVETVKNGEEIHITIIYKQDRGVSRNHTYYFDEKEFVFTLRALDHWSLSSG